MGKYEEAWLKQFLEPRKCWYCDTPFSGGARKGSKRKRFCSPKCRSRFHHRKNADNRSETLKSKGGEK